MRWRGLPRTTCRLLSCPSATLSHQQLRRRSRPQPRLHRLPRLADRSSCPSCGNETSAVLGSTNLPPALVPQEHLSPLEVLDRQNVGVRCCVNQANLPRYSISVFVVSKMKQFKIDKDQASMIALLRRLRYSEDKIPCHSIHTAVRNKSCGKVFYDFRYCW